MSSAGIRVAVSLARVEATHLVRSVLVLSGLLLSGVTVWYFTYRSRPLWWSNDWRIGYGQTLISLTVLVAAQLATGRSRRDGLQQLYESFPSSVGRRTVAHLIGLLGAIPAAVVLIGGAAVSFVLRGAIGTPDPVTLIGGVLLVLAAGAIGVVIGTRFSHPLAGILGAFVWFLPFSQSNRISGASTWLLPWVKPAQLNDLPGRIVGYPPEPAHTAELAAITVLAGSIALAITAAGRRHRVPLVGAAAAALAATVLACAVQLQPIPTGDVDRAVTAAANTGSAQQCTTKDHVRYCLIPGFGSLAPSLSGPVNDVLAGAPAQRSGVLTISQTSALTVDDPTLTHGHSSEQVAAWNAQLHQAPANLPSSSEIYVDLAAWPADGNHSTARFDLALAAGEWAVGLPTNTGEHVGLQSNQCVPLNQAREAIAIWLAARATHLPSAGMQSSDGSYTIAPVDGVAVVAWEYPGEVAEQYVLAGPQTTAVGYLLAQAMTKLPADRVTAVLRAGWNTWTTPDATDTQLAASLGITMPAVPLVGPHGRPITPLLPSGPGPSQPQCT